jgi:hypothetical protein
VAMRRPPTRPKMRTWRLMMVVKKYNQMSLVFARKGD